jgi:hypothetical protein
MQTLPAPAAPLQAAYDEELRRRIENGETTRNGYRSPMTNWAMRKLKVSREVAAALWKNRAPSFRAAGCWLSYLATDQYIGWTVLIA